MRLDNIILRNKESIIKYVIIWVLTFILVALPFGIEIATALIVPLVIPVHLNYYLFDRYFKKKQYVKYGIYTGLLALIFGFFAQGLSANIILTKFEYISPLIKEIPDEVLRIRERPVLKFAFNPLIVMALTTFYKYFQEKQENVIKELETQRLKAELDFLKGQINPHFLFNVLNNLFSMSSKYGDDATANGIGHLSHLMRYMLYDTNSEFVRLENEIDMLENFIDLQKLRMDKNIENIEFNVSGNINNKQIPPMLLIPFVENAFKHGYSIHNDFYVKIDLKSVNDDLIFNVENTINFARENKNMDNSGIGLENVRKRLELLYKDEYSLEVLEKDQMYLVSLVIPMKKL
jgi:sensor histidine kinase YesM